MSDDRERRIFGADLELRNDAGAGQLRLVGYACRTNTPYEVGDFEETITRGAFQDCLASKPDVVLLDLTVSGGMGGLEAAARLKELDSSVKLIVSSGYSDAPVLSDLGKYGFDDLIPKPWTIGRMSEVLRSCIKSNRSSRS